jgi:2-keto-3-deoxy-L-rhamnonate aldolase RhmA
MIFKNAIKDAARNGTKAYGVRLTIPSPEIVDILQPAGLDFVFIDAEHGVFDMPSIENICRAADLVGLTPIARVPDITDGTITQFLDRGIRGIIGPHIATKEDALQLVSATRFGPLGRRSFGGGRGANYMSGIDDLPAFMKKCDESVIVGAMMESQSAIDNLDDILSVEGIDYLMFGPADFAQDLGYAGENKHPNVMQVAEEAIAKIHAAGRLMREDIMVVANIKNFILDGATAFAAERGA